jgi:hypothetical protein
LRAESRLREQGVTGVLNEAFVVTLRVMTVVCLEAGMIMFR